MRFKQLPGSSLPPINLTPMLNVMMAILAFFVMITMMLGTQVGLEVALPSNQPSTPSATNEAPEPLVVQLSRQGQLLIHDQPTSRTALRPQVQEYLAKNPKGSVVLVADLNQPYELVLQILGDMQDVGGEQVSLSLDDPTANSGNE